MTVQPEPSVTARTSGVPASTAPQSRAAQHDADARPRAAGASVANPRRVRYAARAA